VSRRASIREETGLGLAYQARRAAIPAIATIPTASGIGSSSRHMLARIRLCIILDPRALSGSVRSRATGHKKASQGEFIPLAPAQPLALRL